MKKSKLSFLVLLMALAGMALHSCSDEYEDREIIKDSYTGNIDLTSGGLDPAGDFTGNGDSGTFSFAWLNPDNKASANFDITSTTGSVRLKLKDDAGTVVLDKTLNASGNDSFSGVSDPGNKGTWIVELILVDFNGDGSYSLHPGE